MTRTRPFLLVVAGLMVLGAVLEARAPRVDLFRGLSGGARLALDDLTTYEMAAAKIAHGLDADRYDLGLFGNSRSIQVAAANLAPGVVGPGVVGPGVVGPGGGRFFNFSVPGTSIRNSVVMAETLAAHDRLPRTVVVSFDNAELQYFKNPDYPAAPRRWANAIGDVTRGLADPDTGLRDVARLGWRHLLAEWQAFTLTFAFEPALRGVTWPLGLRPGTGPAAPGFGYGPDGSRRDGRPGQPAADLPVTTPAPPAVLDGYLRQDLARLARLRDGHPGTRVLVYESPLAPPAQARLGANPSPQAGRTRAAFLDACRDLALECRAAGPLPGDGGAAWIDDTHVPAALLGAYVTNLLNGAGGA